MPTRLDVPMDAGMVGNPDLKVVCKQLNASSWTIGPPDAALIQADAVQPGIYYVELVMPDGTDLPNGSYVAWIVNTSLSNRAVSGTEIWFGISEGKATFPFAGTPYGINATITPL